MPTLYEQVKQIFDAYGVPAYIWYSIAIAESGGRPNAVGDGGCSVGLFQLNRCGGQGAGYTPQQLADPLFNARVAAPAIANAWNYVRSSFTGTQQQQAVEVARRSGHPGGSVGNPFTGASSLFQVIQSVVTNWLHRGGTGAPEFGGIFKNGYYGQPVVVGAVPPGYNAGGSGSGIPVSSTSGSSANCWIYNPFDSTQCIMPNPFANVNSAQVLVGAIGIIIILIAIIAIVWQPATRAAKEITKAGTEVAAVAA